MSVDCGVSAIVLLSTLGGQPVAHLLVTNHGSTDIEMDQYSVGTPSATINSLDFWTLVGPPIIGISTSGFRGAAMIRVSAGSTLRSTIPLLDQWKHRSAGIGIHGATWAGDVLALTEGGRRWCNVVRPITILVYDSLVSGRMLQVCTLTGGSEVFWLSAVAFWLLF